MSSSFLIEKAGQNLSHGVVTSVTDIEVMVAFDHDLQDVLPADFLQTSDGAQLRLQPGDVVLVWRPAEDAQRAVIFGRITAPVAAAVPTTDARAEIPDTLVLEARESLTLRVGNGSITIRADGKILIKGKDLVSHAQRMNRIRGGAVAIN